MDPIVELLHQSLTENFKIKAWNGAKITPLGDAVGYTSDLLRAEPDWEGENLPKSFVIKALNYKAIDALDQFRKDDEVDQNQIIMQFFHRNECRFYTILSESNPPPVIIPRIYFCSEGAGPGTLPVIIMEDLGAYKTVDMVDGLNENQLYKVADELAKLHYYSFTHSSWRKVPPFEHPDEESFAAITHYFLGLLKKQKPGYFEHAEKVLEVFNNRTWQQCYRRTCEKDHKSVIVHGDLWCANLMWNEDELKGIIDWQQTHCGTVTEDIMRVLVTGTPAKMRREVTKKVLRRYYEKFQKLFFDAGEAVPFPYEYVEDTYRRMLPLIGGITIFSVGMWSNTPSLKDGSPRSIKRLNEMYDRLEDLLNEVIKTIQNRSAEELWDVQCEEKPNLKLHKQNDQQIVAELIEQIKTSNVQ